MAIAQLERSAKLFMDTLRSVILGELIRDDTFPTYSSTVKTEAYGDLYISLVNLSEDDINWSELLKKAETDYCLLLEYEPSIKKHAAPKLLARFQARYGDWQESAEHLTSFLNLQNVTFYSTGTSELWYEGGTPFYQNNIRIEIDTELRVIDVGLDG